MKITSAEIVRTAWEKTATIQDEQGELKLVLTWNDHDGTEAWFYRDGKSVSAPAWLFDNLDGDLWNLDEYIDTQLDGQQANPDWETEIVLDTQESK
jgi:hypothetical protein